MALPRNSPVPMALPRPSMASWAGLRLRSRPDSRATMVAARLFRTAGISEGASLMARHRSRNLTFLLLFASFELDVRTVNDCNTDSPKKRSPLVSHALDCEAGGGTRSGSHGG